MKEKKLVCGIGINDSDYITNIKETLGYTKSGKQVRKLVWICPFYDRWLSMLQRCYSEKSLLKRPSYAGCSVIIQWHSFMAFKSWMEKQDWEGKVLDKDILFPKNKIYGPDTCVFVGQEVNKFLIESTASKGEWPIGVCFNREKGKFQSRCWAVLTGKQKHLGYFNTPEKAHQAWLTFKLEQAKILASQQSDPRVAAALIDRYENYHNYFGETK